VPYAIEAPFSMLLAGRLVRGRIDAVYRRTQPEGDGDGLVPDSARFLVVDWKTHRADAADPLQLAIYRHAWAEAHQIPVEHVDAAFYYVRSDRLVRPAALADRAELERILAVSDRTTAGPGRSH
jgi:DNA helicase-2/ATP-dependent DNA helicase PcrA